MTNRRFDIIATLAIILIGVLFLVLALQIETSGRRTAAEALVGPSTVPIIISLFIIALGSLELLVIFLEDWRNYVPTGPEYDEEFEPFSWVLVLRIALTAAIGFSYVWMLSATGYLIASACALMVLLVLFGTRSPFRILLIAAIGAAVYYFFFIRLMGVYDPTGWLINFG